jgi:hypothetical protein
LGQVVGDALTDGLFEIRWRGSWKPAGKVRSGEGKDWEQMGAHTMLLQQEVLGEREYTNRYLLLHQ